MPDLLSNDYCWMKSDDWTSLPSSRFTFFNIKFFLISSPFGGEGGHDALYIPDYNLWNCRKFAYLFDLSELTNILLFSVTYQSSIRDQHVVTIWDGYGALRRPLSQNKSLLRMNKDLFSINFKPETNRFSI